LVILWKIIVTRAGAEIGNAGVFLKASAEPRVSVE